MSQPTRSLRSRGDPAPTAGARITAAEPDSWWDHPGRPTPYILWGLLWCLCGTPMVPLDRREGSTGTRRFYRCDTGCGRRPIPAAGLETEVFHVVVEAAVSHFPGWTRRGWQTRRIARSRGRPDRRRELIRSLLHRVTAADPEPRLHWQQSPS